MILTRQFNEIYNLISPDFVLKSMENLIPYRYIEDNLQSALMVSIKETKISKVIEISLLIKYSREGYSNFENYESLLESL